MTQRRSSWTRLTDAQLLAQCETDTYRASGPGGQKRNKTSSAVRLRHPPTGLIVIAEESRSQHENRARALKRMRQALYLKLRDEIAAAALNPESLRQLEDFRDAMNAAERLKIGRKDPRFWPAVGVVLDVIHAVEARMHDAAQAMGITTGNLVSFLQTEPKVFEHANILRTKFGHKPLRAE